MAKYKIGVIGAGARGETFARSLYKGTARAELFGVCDIDAQRLETFCNYCELRDAARWTDVTAFLNAPGLDAVIVTVPEFAHAEVTVAALRAGRHVYIEKPLAHTLAACRDMLRAQRESGKVAYVGFNMRASPAHQKVQELVAAGAIGQVLHISGVEQLHRAHGAAFMRRWHRWSSRSGGLLNTKCSHDLDIMLWIIGHRHRVTRLASFGGCSVFTPDKQPAERCSVCPQVGRCPYADRAGFVFPVGGPEPLHHPDLKTYGGDLCVYTADKDLVDNQTVIFECDSGIRGSFCLELFQAAGRRLSTVWGEHGMIELDTNAQPSVKLTTSDGDTSLFNFAPRQGGHGGTDPQMIGRFLDAIEAGSAGDSGLAAGMAAAVLALKAEEARRSGQVVTVCPEDYTG